MFKKMNNLKLLPYLLTFSEVARCRSFTAAAHQLGLSKSAVSQHISRLEQEIGQPLLSRNTRGMALTSLGETLLSRSELLQQQVVHALDTINSNQCEPTGRFAITLPHSCENDIVLPALEQLCIEFPRIEPDIVVTDKALDLIQNNLDVAIRAGDLEDSNYRATPLGNSSDRLCASPLYLSRSGTPEKLSELHNHKLIAAPWQKDWLLCGEAQHLPFSLRSNRLPTTLALAKRHLGIVLLPEFCLRQSIRNGELTPILTELSGRAWPFYFVHRFPVEKPLHVARFQELVSHYFRTSSN